MNFVEKLAAINEKVHSINVAMEIPIFLQLVLNKGLPVFKASLPGNANKSFDSPEELVEWLKTHEVGRPETLTIQYEHSQDSATLFISTALDPDTVHEFDDIDDALEWVTAAQGGYDNMVDANEDRKITQIRKRAAMQADELARLEAEKIERRRARREGRTG